VCVCVCVCVCVRACVRVNDFSRVAAWQWNGPELNLPAQDCSNALPVALHVFSG